MQQRKKGQRRQPWNGAHKRLAGLCRDSLGTARKTGSPSKFQLAPAHCCLVAWQRYLSRRLDAYLQPSLSSQTDSLEPHVLKAQRCPILESSQKKKERDTVCVCILLRLVYILCITANVHAFPALPPYLRQIAARSQLSSTAATERQLPPPLEAPLPPRRPFLPLNNCSSYPPLAPTRSTLTSSRPATVAGGFPFFPLCSCLSPDTKPANACQTSNRQSRGPFAPAVILHSGHTNTNAPYRQDLPSCLTSSPASPILPVLRWHLPASCCCSCLFLTPFIRISLTNYRPSSLPFFLFSRSPPTFSSRIFYSSPSLLPPPPFSFFLSPSNKIVHLLFFPLFCPACCFGFLSSGLAHPFSFCCPLLVSSSLFPFFPLPLTNFHLSLISPLIFF